MANFTVEWLSKSYYTTPQKEVTSLVRTQAGDDGSQGDFLKKEGDEHAKESRDQYTPTSPNNSCGYASGSESEVGDDSANEAVQQRRMRTKFTSEQISSLENTFSKHRYLGATQRRKIAEKLNLSEMQVKTWFQNRRMKLKREVQDLRSDFPLSLPSGLLPPILFQHLVPSGQLPALPALPPEPRPVLAALFPALPAARGPLHPPRSLPAMLLPRCFY